ncbi:hypothetical protein TNCV_3062721 [Trichonephila clavipes]|nr:hypothetical protein TNCV_3062721 [Trichonephila clavipes]
MIMRHVKNPLKCPFGSNALGKTKFPSSISHLRDVTFQQDNSVPACCPPYLHLPPTQKVVVENILSPDICPIKDICLWVVARLDRHHSPDVTIAVVWHRLEQDDFPLSVIQALFDLVP